MKPHNMTTFDQWLGSQIRHYRKFRHITQQELGAAIGVSFQQIQKYEKGTNRISVNNLARISEAINTPISILLELSKCDDHNHHISQHSKNHITSQQIIIAQYYASITNEDIRRALTQLVKLLGQVA